MTLVNVLRVLNDVSLSINRAYVYFQRRTMLDQFTRYCSRYSHGVFRGVSRRQCFILQVYRASTFSE